MLHFKLNISFNKKRKICALDVLDVGPGLGFNVSPRTIQSTYITLEGTLVYNVIFTPSHLHICPSQVYTTWILSTTKPNHAELGSPNPTSAALTYPLHMDPRGVVNK
jgi:hypothetical protein